MYARQSAVWSRLALGALSSALGSAMSVSLLAVVPVQAVQAQTLPTCAAAWTATAV